MSDDPLDRALAAYGEVGPGARRSGPDTAATRARLLRSAAAADRRRTMRRWSALAVLLLASNATTWAWTSGRVERAVEAWVAEAPAAGGGGALGAVEPDASAAAPRASAPPTPAMEPDAAAPPAMAASARPDAAHRSAPHRPAPPRRDVEPAVAVARPSSGSTRADRAIAAPDPGALAAAPDPIAASRADAPVDNAVATTDATVDNADRLAFEAAHRAHFDGGDPDAALRAWDAYLARFPRGRFVPEATFNRAICLLRLGRPDEARPALERVASGMYGAAHRDDAAALLERLPAAE